MLIRFLIHLTFTNKKIHSIQHHSFAKPPSRTPISAPMDLQGEDTRQMSKEGCFNAGQLEM
jgi:hypothetical protein